MSAELELSRIAGALERIANALEGKSMRAVPVTIKLDGKVLAQSVVRETIKRAARGPSGLVGGSLGPDES